MDKACSTNGRKEAYATAFYFEYLKENYHLGDLGVERRIVLMSINFKRNGLLTHELDAPVL